MSEVKTTIGFSDILTLEIECVACGACVTRKVSNYHINPAGCTNCNADWGYLVLEFKQLTNLINMLRYFSAKSPAKDALPFRLRFEIASKEARQ